MAHPWGDRSGEPQDARHAPGVTLADRVSTVGLGLVRPGDRRVGHDGADLEEHVAAGDDLDGAELGRGLPVSEAGEMNV